MTKIVSSYLSALSLKSTLEGLFGLDEWKKLKDHRSIKPWRASSTKVLTCSKVAFHENVQIADEGLFFEVDLLIDGAIADIDKAQTLEEILDTLSAAYIRLSFLQLGHAPCRNGSQVKVMAIPSHWKLSQFRSVIYFQNQNQKEDATRRLSVLRDRLSNEDGIFSSTDSKLPRAIPAVIKVDIKDPQVG